MSNVNLSSPWNKFAREVMALFGEDSEIKIIYSEEEKTIELLVDNQAKAEALMQLLPSEKKWGNVALEIKVTPANVHQETPESTLFAAAFSGNPAFAFAQKAGSLFSFPMTYIVFKNKVVQFFNDDMSDVYANCSTLYQELAKDIFEERTGISFCTDVPHSIESE